MRCECDDCQGSGKIECYSCDGRGYVDNGIEHRKLEKNDPNFEELLALQKDAQRAIRQADQLKKLKPDRSGSYADQLLATLREINQQADKISI